MSNSSPPGAGGALIDARVGLNFDIERSFQLCAEHEKTLTLHALLQCLTPLQLQFFSTVFQHIQASSVPADQREEAQRKANDPSFLRTSLQLAEKSPVGEALIFLTKTLALLRPDNTAVAAIVLSFVVDLPSKEQYSLNDTSYALLKNVLAMMIVHPAFNEKQRYYLRDSIAVMTKREGEVASSTNNVLPPLLSQYDNATTGLNASNIVLAPKPFRRSSVEDRANNSNSSSPVSSPAPIRLNLANSFSNNNIASDNTTTTTSHPFAATSGESGIASEVYLPPFKQGPLSKSISASRGLSKSPSFEFDRFNDESQSADLSFPNTSAAVNNNNATSSSIPNGRQRNSYSEPRAGGHSRNPSDHYNNSPPSSSSQNQQSGSLSRSSSSIALSSQGIDKNSSSRLLQQSRNMKHAASMSNLSDVRQQQQQNEGTFVSDIMNVPEGVNSIALWLRSLRLHKYTEQLQNLDMVTMSTFTDDDFAKHGVSAQGARRKLIQAIKSVTALQARVAPLAKEIIQPGRFMDAIAAMKEVLNTYKAQLLSCGMFLEFVKQYTAVLFKGFCHLSVNEPHREHHLAFIKLIRMSISSRSFPKRDQGQYSEWRDELERLAVKFGFLESLDDPMVMLRNGRRTSGGMVHSQSSYQIPRSEMSSSVSMTNLSAIAGGGAAGGAAASAGGGFGGLRLGLPADDDDEEGDVGLLLARQRRQRRSRANRSKSESSATLPLDVPLGPLTDSEKQEMERQILEEMQKELRSLNSTKTTIESANHSNNHSNNSSAPSSPLPTRMRPRASRSMPVDSDANLPSVQSLISSATGTKRLSFSPDTKGSAFDDP